MRDYGVGWKYGHYEFILEECKHYGGRASMTDDASRNLPIRLTSGQAPPPISAMGQSVSSLHT